MTTFAEIDNRFTASDGARTVELPWKTTSETTSSGVSWPHVVQPEGEWQPSIDGLGRGERCPQMPERTVLGLWRDLRHENGLYTGGGRVKR